MNEIMVRIRISTPISSAGRKGCGRSNCWKIRKQLPILHCQVWLMKQEAVMLRLSDFVKEWGTAGTQNSNRHFYQQQMKKVQNVLKK